jgi:hypothetical protein
VPVRLLSGAPVSAPAARARDRRPGTAERRSLRRPRTSHPAAARASRTNGELPQPSSAAHRRPGSAVVRAGDDDPVHAEDGTDAGAGAAHRFHTPLTVYGGTANSTRPRGGQRLPDPGGAAPSVRSPPTVAVHRGVAGRGQGRSVRRSLRGPRPIRSTGCSPCPRPPLRTAPSSCPASTTTGDAPGVARRPRPVTLCPRRRDLCPWPDDRALPQLHRRDLDCARPNGRRPIGSRSASPDDCSRDWSWRPAQQR